MRSTTTTTLWSLVALLATTAAITGCGSSGSSSTQSTAEAQSAATGDIPDNQQFLVYRNRGAGYSIKYPEGWARKGPATALTFSDKGNSVTVAVARGSAPSPAQARAALQRSVPANAGLKVKTARTETIGGRPVLHLTYTRKGPVDPVTGKSLVLMVDRYVVAHGGRVATIDESTPVGVDNVDAYRLIIGSFKWT